MQITSQLTAVAESRNNHTGAADSEVTLVQRPLTTQVRFQRGVNESQQNIDLTKILYKYAIIPHDMCVVIVANVAKVQ